MTDRILSLVNGNEIKCIASRCMYVRMYTCIIMYVIIYKCQRGQARSDVCMYVYTYVCIYAYMYVPYYW